MFNKVLSKSTVIMFLFDLSIFVLSTIFWYTKFKLTSEHLVIVLLLTVLTGIVVLFLKDNYKIREFNISSKNYYLLFEGIIISHVPLLIFLLIINHNLQTLEFIGLNILTVYIFLAAYRNLFHLYLFKFKKIKNVLIVGTNKEARLIADEIINKKALKMQVIGFVKDNDEENIINDSNTKIFDQENLKEVIKNNNIDIIIIAIKHRIEESILTNMVYNISNNIKVYKMPDFYEMVTGKYYVSKMSINWLFYDFMNRRSILYNFCKRTFDIISALIILIVTAPILVYIGIKVKNTDGASPIYTQNRVGKNGKVFKAYKLRTMYVNDYVPTKDNLSKADNQNIDDRVIPFCKFVRKARLDEIPQMINILKGDMSIVGPRCEWEDLVNIYSKEIPYYKCRQWVRTGWTGWAQINQGHLFSADSEAEKLQYDLYYLKHRNLFWEIGILVKAIFLALGGRHD